MKGLFKLQEQIYIYYMNINKEDNSLIRSISRGNMTKGERINASDQISLLRLAGREQENSALFSFNSTGSQGQ